MRDWKPALSVRFIARDTRRNMTDFGTRGGDEAPNWSPLVSPRSDLLRVQRLAAISDDSVVKHVVQRLFAARCTSARGPALSQKAVAV